MGWNLTFALLNGIVGIIYTSYWYLTLFAFYLTLGMMKLDAVTVSKIKKKKPANMLRNIGIAMFALAIILSGMMIITLREMRTTSQNKVMMIIIAAFTFTFLGITIRNTIKARLHLFFYWHLE